MDSGSAFQVICGDAVAVLRGLPACSFDACLCDPPYGLKFMGATWDHGVPSAETWREVLRVLKPGAALLAFGGTRTFHRLVCAIEDAGFELRDTLCWLYGSGFPKSHNLSAAIDKVAGAIGKRGDYKSADHAVKRKPGSERKHEGWARPWMEDLDHADQQGRRYLPATPEAAQWEGYGTALKPAWEPIILAMNPLDGITFAENAVRWGCGGLNIDGCRIEGAPWNAHDATGLAETKFFTDGNCKVIHKEPHDLGRWPANLLLDEESAELLDEASGYLSTGTHVGHNRDGGKHSNHILGARRNDIRDIGYSETGGGASRFFWIAKADSAERSAGLRDRNQHPTVKPIDLAAYLAKLILPPKRDTPRRIITPFCGSGSEIIGALRAGWEEAVGIEQEEKWCEVARERIVGDAPLFTQELRP